MTRMAPTEDEVAWVRERLLSFLRMRLEREVTYVEVPTAIDGGYESTVYGFRIGSAPEGWECPLILRINPRDANPSLVRRDEILHRVLRGAGYPVPSVLASCSDPGPLGGAFIIAERFAGRDLFSALFPAGARRIVPELVELQARLHAIDSSSFVIAAREDEQGEDMLEASSLDWQLHDMRRRIEAAALGGLVPGWAWLTSHRPAVRDPVLCHGDLHPRNILVGPGRAAKSSYAVLDWTLMTLAPREFDVGSTRMLLSFAPAGVPTIVERIAGLWQERVIARRYIAEYTGRRPLDAHAVSYYEAWRCLRALCWAGESYRAMFDGVGSHRAGPWDARHISSRVARRFREISGVRVALPR